MNSATQIGGIHHITAISSTASENVAFYEKVLGLRLVKQTVNFDDPFTYHLYYGDAVGRPGTILTFFPWAGLLQGENGAGMVTAAAFAVPKDSLPYWLSRLERHGIKPKLTTRFGEEVAMFRDPHGMHLELVASWPPLPKPAAAEDDWEDRHRIRGFHSATALLSSLAATEQLLTERLGLTLKGQEGNRYRFAMASEDVIGCFYDLVIEPQAAPGHQGCGSVHHIAFRTASGEEQRAWLRDLRRAGYEVTDVRDRNYFTSIYFHEPGGVLFEIATDPPGFTVDEPLEQLGSALKLPRQYEPMRGAIEQQLPPLRQEKFVYAYLEPNGSALSDLTIVALHGTGGDEHGLLPLAREIAPGAAVISPRGRVVENGMNRFFRRLGPNVFDEADIRFQAGELADFLLSAASRRHRPPERLVALGYSNGANIAAALLLLRPEVFSRAILLRPMLALATLADADLDGREILVLRGTDDRMIPPESTDKLILALSEAGARVDTIDIDAGHELTAADVREASRWLAGSARR